MSVDITYENLKISTFDVVHIKELKITGDINKHAELELLAVLYDDKGDKVVQTTEENTPIDVYYKDEGGKQKYIFRGVISNIKINVVQDVYYLRIKAYSFTYKMDIEKKSRSFQNIHMTSHDLIKKVMKNYKKSDVLINIPNVPIKDIVIQYQETDWEFIKRFVSKYNQCVFPEIQQENIKYFIGIPHKTAETEMKAANYSVYKQIDLFREMKKNHLPDAKELDYIIYEIETTDIFTLGSSVKFKDVSFTVGSVCHELKKGILYSTYKLQLKDGLRPMRIYNMEMVGISLQGIVSDVKRDTVQVMMDIDGEDYEDSVYWFPYSTMSASPDGSGWYCMPELGDMVRVYLPTKDEKDAYTISSVNSYMPEEGSNDRMSDPNVKFIRTQDDKEVKFTPEGIEINSDSGQAVIKLNNDGTISITGKNSININAQEEINIRSEKVMTLTAMESVDLSCDKGGNISLSPSGEVLVKGTEVKNN